MDRFLNCDEILKIYGWSRSTLDRREKCGEFPKRIQLSPNKVVWPESAILAHQEKLKNQNKQSALPVGIASVKRGRR